MSEKVWVPQTMAATFARIVADPGAAWLAVGDFLDDYRSLPPDERAALVATPIAALGDDLVSRRWAAFCAATVDLLCWRDNIPIPRWTGQPLYRLPEPWFVYDAAELARVEADLTTLRIAELIGKLQQAVFDRAHLRAVHRHIFQDLYAWAGELRTVDIRDSGADWLAPALP